jgi:hypothetical protein
MSYDIYFVRRDPGQTFEDALDELEGTFQDGDPGELTDVDIEHWEELLPRAREILGDHIEIDDEDDSSHQLTDPDTGVELTLIRGEIEIHVPDHRRVQDDLELMSAVYDLARAVEDVTGMEGYDPQLGEPVSDRDESAPTHRRWPDDVPDDAEDEGRRGRRPAPQTLVGDQRPEMAPDRDAGPRRWWEFWKP